MSVIRCLGLSVFVSLLAVGPLAAQHLDGTGDPDDDRARCGLCHSTHPGGREVTDAYILRSSRDVEQVLNRASVIGAGASVRGCLLCHLSSEVRELGVPAGAKIEMDRGRYLGYELSDDHPIGKGPFTNRRDRYPRQSPLSEPSAYRTQSNLSESFIVGESSVDCSSCHDPHRPGEQSLLVDEVQVVCTACHRSAGYVQSGHSSVPCSGCHQLHGANERGMLRSGIDANLCGACHSAGLTEFIESPLLRASIVPGPIGHPEPPEEPCRACHLAH